MDTKNALEKLLDNIVEALNDFDEQERIVVLCAVSEHCKAYAQTMLMHEYHGALYGRKQVSE